MSSRFTRLYHVIVEWGTLGSFVILGDMAAQRVEYMIKESTIVVNRVNNSNKKLDSKDNANILITNPFQLDKSRVVAASCTGLLFVAPVCMIWFPLLHSFMAKYLSHLVEGSLKYVGTKVLLENALIAPPICLSYFVIPSLIEEQREGEENSLNSKLEKDFLSTLTTDISFWCIMSPLNYKYIPVRYVIVSVFL